jgi:hypothetical protein
MELLVDLGDLRLRTLTGADAALLVEATQAESGRALWGPHPAGPYSIEDARAALQAWDPRRHGQVSFGALQGEWLVAALASCRAAPTAPSWPTGSARSSDVAGSPCAPS